MPTFIFFKRADVLWNSNAFLVCLESWHKYRAVPFMDCSNCSAPQLTSSSLSEKWAVHTGYRVVLCREYECGGHLESPDTGMD